MNIERHDFGKVNHLALRYLIIFFLLVSSGTSVHAAYCSLRDPVAAIRTLYPEADRHYSIVRTITHEMRDQLGERLPFTLHFNELGRHTLYVAQHEAPLGFVHARSELSDWGIVEIAWALTTNLEVDSFYFQRCRSPACNDALQRKLSSELQGKSLDEVLALITPEGDSLTPVMTARYQRDHRLVLAIIRSAIKTLAVTESAWNADIKELRRRELAMQGLGGNALPELRPISDSELEAIHVPDADIPEYDFIMPSSVQVFGVILDGEEVARLVEARWQLGERSGDFSWLFSKTGEVLTLETYDPMPDTHTASAFEQLLGRDLGVLENCASAAEITGGILYLNAYR